MNTTASNARLHKMVGCALFAALTAVCSQLAIPMPWGVPINLARFAVYMAGTMLGPVWGAASQLVYLLLAAVGVPVMAGMQGGPAVLLGKTGGYAIGYLLARVLCVSVFERAIGFNWLLGVASQLLSVLIAVIASIPPVRRATRIDPAIVLREE